MIKYCTYIYYWSGSPCPSSQNVGVLMRSLCLRWEFILRSSTHYTNISSTARVQVPQIELNWPTRDPQDLDVNWDLLLTQILLYTLILSVTWQYERSRSNWEWHVYRRRWVIRQIRTRKGLRGRYRPVKPIWRWQGKITAKPQHIAKRHVWYFPQFCFSAMSLCFLQPMSFYV